MFSVKIKITITIAAGIFLLMPGSSVFSQIVEDSITNSNSFPVVLEHDTLFFIDKNIGSVTAQQRASSVSKKLLNVARQTNFKPDSFKVEESEIYSNILYKDIILNSVFQVDIKDTSMSRIMLATNRMELMRNSANRYNSEHGIKLYSQKILISIAVIIFLLATIWLVKKLFDYLKTRIITAEQTRFKQIKIGNYLLLSSEQVQKYTTIFLNGLRIIITVLIVYMALPVIFRLFPSTESIATYMWNLVYSPLHNIFNGTVAYIPNLFAIAVISVFFYYLIKVLNYFASEVATGKLVIKGFYAEWSKPTLSLIKFLVFVFYFIVIYRFLPGANSKVFQGVTVFLGLLVSIGSSSAISNVVAGLVITYMRPFRIGSFVKIGEVEGTVTEKNLLVTRIETIKNQEITIPNSTVLSSYTLNYGYEKSGNPLIVHTTVTIGYNAPWKKVHELLINAASATENILREPAPFVLQTGLNDFYISYQINAYTDKPNIQANTLSDLHQHIQDKFNEAGVEIMSPHYSNLRDGNQSSIPAEYLDKDYKTPRFNVNIESADKKENSKQLKLNL